MAKIIDKLKGFRDFFPEDCAVRNYVFEHWRGIAARYGFVEYEGPILESTELLEWSLVFYAVSIPKHLENFIFYNKFTSHGMKATSTNCVYSPT